MPIFPKDALKPTQMDVHNIKFTMNYAKEFFEIGRLLESQSFYAKIVNMLKDIKSGKSQKPLTVEMKSLISYIGDMEEIYFRVESMLANTRAMAKHYMSVKIPSGLMGLGYETYIGEFLTVDVEEILIEEPLMCEPEHFANLNALLNVIMKFCGKVYVLLATYKDNRANSKQMKFFKMITAETFDLSVHLEVKFTKKLHGASILLSTGYWLKSTNGLHIFRPLPDPSLHAHHFRFRYAETKETVLSVYHVPHLGTHRNFYIP